LKTILLFLLFIFYEDYAISQHDPCIPPREIKNEIIIQKANNIRSNEFDLLLTLERIKISTHKYACKFNATSTFQNEITKQLKNTKVNAEIFDETGFSYINDSNFNKNKDLSRIKGSLLITEFPKKFEFSISSMLQSQKLNSFVNDPDSAVKRKLQSGPFSPGILTLALGFKKEIKPDIHLELGLAGTKITWISNKQLYIVQQTEEIAGVSRDKKANIEGGFSFHGKMDKQIAKHFKFQNTTIVFKDIFTNHDLSIEFRNSLSWEPVKYVSTALRTVYTYDPNRWPPSLWLGEFNVGLNLEKTR
jgi:hypothetical protein